MSVNPEFIAFPWLLFGAFVYAGCLLFAVGGAQWRRLRNQRDLNILLFAILGVIFMWRLDTSFIGNQSAFTLNMHFSGATLMTLMFGWAFAMLAMSIVVLVTTLSTATPHMDALVAIPWNTLLTGVLPVLASYHLFRFADRRLPNHFFVYIFVCTFFGAALAVASVMFATTGFHYLSGSFNLEYLKYNYYSYTLLLMFPEAFLTGMLMSIFVVYRPQWVSTFDDQRYLRNH